jgi:glutaredoxin 3
MLWSGFFLLISASLYFTKYSIVLQCKHMDKATITIYGAEWCAFCHTAMRYLDDLGVKGYKYIDVDTDPAAGLEAVNKSGQRGIPVLDIGGDIIVGFDRPAIDTSLKAHKLV